MEYYGNGEFEFITEEKTQFYYKDAHNAISRCELWDWLRDYPYDPSEFYTFCVKCPEFNQLLKQLHSGHSGGSLMITINNMNYIAKNGYEKYKTQWINSLNS
jgi:hypothetical protein